MKKITFYVLLFCSFCVYSSDTTSVKYFPLNIGNVWFYKWYYYHPPFPVDSGISRVSILKDTTVNFKRYFYFKGSPDPGPLGIFWVRVDSLNGRLVRLYNSSCSYSPDEILIDSLSSKKNDTARECTFPPRICSDTGIITMFGIQTRTKNFFGSQLSCECLDYAKNIGLFYSSNGELASKVYNLKGCIINGVVFGDTVLSEISPINNSIPVSFSLYQNYPNPFNPTTKIKFDIPLSRGVPEGRGVLTHMTIYDLLGREVATLVNENLLPGIYEAEWNASNYPSGVYFYKLQTETFNITKRMVLIK